LDIGQLRAQVTAGQQSIARLEDDLGRVNAEKDELLTAKLGSEEIASQIRAEKEEVLAELTRLKLAHDELSVRSEQQSATCCDMKVALLN
jgi:hypothetical protein